VVTGDTLAYVSYSRTENSSALGVWRDGPGMSAIVDISTTGQINSIQREPDPWIYGHGGISKLMCFYPSQLQVIIYVITSSIQHVLSYCSTIFHKPLLVCQINFWLILLVPFREVSTRYRFPVACSSKASR
jgi:hypothetical protein